MFVNVKFDVSVAQLDRVSASDAEGCGFDPRRIRHKKSRHKGGFFYGIKNRGAWSDIPIKNRGAWSDIPIKNRGQVYLFYESEKESQNAGFGA